MSTTRKKRNKGVPGVKLTKDTRLIVNGVPLRFSRRVTVRFPEEFKTVVRFEKSNAN